MTGDAVNGRNGCGARAGARTLNLLAAPLNARALRALGEGAKKQAAARWERRHGPAATPPPAALDVETALLLATELTSMPPGASGSCRLAVELRDTKPLRVAGRLEIRP